jgi:hypothetical protein
MTEWESLVAVAQSADALVASRHGDSYVHRAFYPEDLSFLLRYNVPDDESGGTTGLSGMFDLSANPTMIAKVLPLVPLELRPYFQVERPRITSIGHTPAEAGTV